MDFRQLETFIEVVKLKSFSKAADKLFITQPTVTNHIQNLHTSWKALAKNNTNNPCNYHDNHFPIALFGRKDSEGSIWAGQVCRQPEDSCEHSDWQSKILEFPRNKIWTPG